MIDKTTHLQILVCLLWSSININLLLCIATHPPLPDPGTLKRMTHAKTHDYLWDKKFCQNIP